MAAYRERRYTAQNGLSLYYREYGPEHASRTPVLCLPGLSRNSRDFNDLAGRLAADGRRVLCPDYRGRGRSDYDPDPRNYDARVLVDDIRHLLALSGCHRVIVVGTSMGGLLAMGLGVVTPAALAGVVLNDVGPDLGDDGLGRIIDYVGRDHPQDDWEAATEALCRMLPGLARKPEADLRAAVEGTFRKGADGRLHFDWDPRIVEPLRRRRDLPDLWALFRSLRRLPVLAFRGEASDVLLPETFARMAEAHPALSAVTIPATGHTPTLNEPEAVAALAPFLERL